MSIKKRKRSTEELMATEADTPSGRQLAPQRSMSRETDLCDEMRLR